MTKIEPHFVAKIQKFRKIILLEMHRCLIPASKFYEWKSIGEKKKEKYEFFAPGEILYLAGIYHKDPEGGRFTILTREAEGCMTGIHHRMPRILRKKDIEVWLFSKQDADKLLERHFADLQRKNSETDSHRQMSLF